MDLVNGSEISFVDGFSIKPFRTFIVNTNAPLHSNGFDVPPSGGVATCSHRTNYGDRIFLWRAIGQKLYIEERSLLYTIVDGSLCIDFTRTAIIPGTTITIFEEGIFSIVVPTASAIYRFYARVHTKGKDTFSILARIKEDEEFRRFQTSHSLSTPGRPIRASATHHPNKNTISYCTAEGQLVIVQMGAYTDTSDKHEEYTIGEVGLIGKLLGGRDKRISDACVMKNRRAVHVVSKERKSNVTSDIVFAVTRDGWVQAWNVATRKQLPTAIDLNMYFASEGKAFGQTQEDPEFEIDAPDAEPTELFYSIKAYHVEVDILLVVGCDVVVGGKGVGTRVHLLKMTEDHMEHLKVFETSMGADERLVDFDLIQTFFPEKPVSNGTNHSDTLTDVTAADFSLTALFKSSSAKKSYSMRRVSFAIEWNNAATYTNFDWHHVKQFTSPAASKGEPSTEKKESDAVPTRPYNLSADSSVESLVDVVFDTDLYSFDIVFRAVQIVSDNFRGSCAQVRHNNWPELTKLVDAYVTSVEFNRKFQQKTDRSIRLRLNAPQETQTSALKDFWWALLKACEELDFAARGVISLAPIQLAGDLRIMAVVHRDRMTILGDNNADFLDIIGTDSVPQSAIENRDRKVPNKQFVDLIDKASVFAEKRVFLMNRERVRTMSAKRGVQLADDDGIDNAGDSEKDGRFLTIKTSLEAPIVELAAAFVRTATYDNSKPFGDPCEQAFAGSFTQSLVAANIRVTVESRVIFALTLQSLLNSITEKKLRAGAASFGDVEALCCELREIIRVYRELNEQLDLKIFTITGAKMSVGTWLTSDKESLKMMKKEGGYGPNGYLGIRKDDFNWFIGVTTDAAVRALLSTSEILILPRRLVLFRQYKVLLTILNSYISETRILKPVITFFRGIALSGTDHPVKAMHAFQSCLDEFKAGNVALRKAIYYLLPNKQPVTRGDPIAELGQSEFFLVVVRFLQDHKHSEEVCTIAMKAIENLPIENQSVQLISNTLFNQLSQRREWFQALKLILRTTMRAETRRASICDLLTQMLGNGEWEAIATMKFGVHEQVVEDFLREAAIRQTANEKKHYFELLFAFYMARKDFRRSATVMYEYARHIESAPQMTPELLRRRRDCLAVVLNLQSVLSIKPDEDETVFDDWTNTDLVFPKPEDDDDELDSSGESVRKPQGRPADSKSSSSGSSPDTKSTTTSEGSVDLGVLRARQMAYALAEMDGSSGSGSGSKSGTRSIEKRLLSKRRKLLVLTEKDIRDEWVLCSARVGLLSSDQYKGVPPTDPVELFSLLVDTFHFDEAFDIARQFNLNPRKLFFNLTREAIMIDALRDDVVIEMAATNQAGWVRLNRRHCVAVATAEDHWAVVRGLIDAAHSEWPGDSRALRGASEAFLSYKKNVPYWLQTVFENRDPNDFLRCLLDYENYSVALQVLGEFVERETCEASQVHARTWLPYGVIDELMIKSADFVRKASVQSPEDQVLAIEVATLRKSVDQKLVIYFRKVADFEHAQKMSNRYFEN